MAEAWSYPGIDPRQWCSYGVVDAEDSVVFDPEYGPLVSVTLKPSETPVLCRVGMSVAGNGEGEFYPFVGGDEVFVGIPEGSERGDCVILARLTNSVAKFPMSSVAGQDPTTNTFGFKRHRTAFIHEVAGRILLREATSEAFLSIDSKGVVTVRDGQKAALQMSADAFGYQSGDAKFLLQLDLTGKRFTLQVDDAIFTLASSGASPEISAVNVPGVLVLSTNANPGAEHVVTTEALFNVLHQWQQIFFAAWSAAWASIVTPAVGAPLGPALTGPLAAIFNDVTLAGAATAAGQASLQDTIAAAIFGAFSAAQAKPPAVPGVGQLKPGIGCAGLMAG